MTVIDFKEYIRNKKSLLHAPMEKNEEVVRSALCYELEQTLRKEGYPSVRVLYHKTEYVFILNINLWVFFKIRMAEFFGIFSWKDAMAASIKKIDPKISKVTMYRTWPTPKQIQSILSA